jgi:hypothetical protein
MDRRVELRDGQVVGDSGDSGSGGR